MLNSLRIVVVHCLLAASLCLSAVAKGPAYDDPKKVDDDFAIQGEYSGMLMTKEGEEKFGVQIIALGGGEFRAVGYHGGLPGDGWNGEEPVRIEGEPASDKKGDFIRPKVKDGVLMLKDEHGTGIVKNGVLICTVEGRDAPVGKLKRIIRKSPTLGAKPPQGAVVLFDGSSADAWKNGKMTDDGLLMQGTTSKQAFGDHRLHIEFRLPYQPQDRGQGRGNSGMYVQGRYEVQMLDSFGLEGKNNECGGLYEVRDPDLNMCLPPLSWQTYDVDYTVARYDDRGKLLASPRITVRHNGVVIHDDVELPGDRSTRAAPVKPGAEPGPLYLQNHGNPVRYRNIWVVETKN